jgi:hypothetical protein
MTSLETDIEAYNRVQAVERALTRVQNYVADLAIAAVKLAGLERPDGHRESAAHRAFAAAALLDPERLAAIRNGMVDRSLAG